jgi:hypothetical protein
MRMSSLKKEYVIIGRGTYSLLEKQDKGGNDRYILTTDFLKNPKSSIE